MRGVQELVELRMQGVIPTLVRVDLDMPRAAVEPGRLQVEAEDRIAFLDLRALQGLDVAVSALDADRGRAVADACKQAGARRVIATFSERRGSSDFNAVEMTDTEGVFTWKR